MEIYVQRDAPEIIRRRVRSMVPEGTPVRGELPDGWTVTDGEVVTVVGDGTPSSTRVLSSENVRVAVYSRHEPKARQLAKLIDAFLLDPHISWGFSISPGPGLLCARDADTGGWVCSVTVVAESPKKGMRL